MRIAVSGAHHTGKTTLVDDLVTARPGYVSVDEPYRLLEEDGYEFANPPSLDDFLAQLQRSIEVTLDADDDCILDRCPADLLAYLLTHDGDDFDATEYLPRVREAMETLDLVVFVPIETPDRIVVPQDDAEADLRNRVDDELHAIHVDDRWSFDREVIVVAGERQERKRIVLERIP